MDPPTRGRAPTHAARVAALLLALGCRAGRPATQASIPRAAACPLATAHAPTFPAGWPWQAGSVARASSRRGVVVSTDRVASEVGAEVLRRGGNAVDAAVATLLALAVVNPEAGNLGGGGYALVVLPDGTARALDFRETAPAAATREMFLRAPAVQGRPASLLGPLAVGVPGTVAGLWALHQAHGARPWAELVAPALGLARGMVVHERLATSLRTFRELLASDPGARAVFLRPDGTPPRVGDPFAQPDLASTLEALARDGAQGFYRGAFAARVDAWMREHGGLLTAADLAGYTPRWREPLRVRYRGWTLVTMAPSSSGGLTLGLLLGVLDARGEAPPWHTADAVHVFAEASRRAFADRNAWLGDPDAVDVPTARLLDPAYLRARARELPPERATAPGGTRPGTVEGTHTTHVSVADGHGGFVAVTTTLNALYGARVLVPGTGVLLNNQMDDFSTRPGEANRYGLVQGPHNEVAPGRRMASSMAPTVALDPSGVVRVVLGSPGGATIPSTVAQVLANIIDHGMDPASAVAAPRLHRQDAPEALYFERGGLDPEALASLRARGHTPEERPGFQGDVQLVALRCDGSLLGLSDPRRGGAPAAPPEDVAVVH